MRVSVTALVLLCLLLSVPVSAATTAADHVAAGTAAMERGDVKAAAASFEKATALEPRNAKNHFLLATAYSAQARTASIATAANLTGKIKSAFETAVALDPGYLDARFGLMQFYLMVPKLLGGSEEKALIQASVIKSRDPLAGHRAYARIYTHQKKPDLARKEMIDAVREQPNNARAHYYLGNHYMTEKNWDGARHEYEVALKLEPGFLPIQFRIGMLAANSGKDLARGEESLRKYLTHKPLDTEPSKAQTWYYLGLVQEKLGKKAEAKTSYANALKLAPGSKDVTEALKRVS